MTFMKEMSSKKGGGAILEKSGERLREEADVQLE